MGGGPVPSGRAFPLGKGHFFVIFFGCLWPPKNDEQKRRPKNSEMVSLILAKIELAKIGAS